MQYLAVCGFHDQQHYKNRRPPWIKLHVELLDSYAFAHLPDAAKWQYVGLCLLASRFENRIPDDPAWVARLLHSTAPLDLDALIASGLVERVHDASDTLAARKQSARPETETEGEERQSRGEREAATAATAAAVLVLESFPAVADCLSDGEPSTLGEQLAALVAAPAVLRGMLSDCNDALTGGDGFTLTPRELRRAVADYVASGETPNASRFRGYLRRAKGPPPPTAPPRSPRGARAPARAPALPPISALARLPEGF